MDTQRQKWAERLGVSIHSIYAWTRHYSAPADERKVQDAQADEVRRLKAELKRVTEERDILRKAAAYFAKTSASILAANEEQVILAIGGFLYVLATCASGLLLSHDRDRYRAKAHPDKRPQQ